MPFKIVATIERGRSVLTAVPSEWENGGSLFWPRSVSTKVEKIRRMEHSKPEAGWTSLNCIVKRTNLASLKVAELEIEKMCGYSDTETDNDKENEYVKKKLQPASNLLFEDLVQQCINETETDSNLKNKSHVPNVDHAITTLQNQLEPQVVSQSQENQVDVVSEFQDPQIDPEPRNPPEYGNIEVNNDQNTLATNINNLMAKIETIQNNQSILQENINIVIENQKLFFEGQQLLTLNLSQTVTQLEEFMKQSRVPNKTVKTDFQLIQNHEQLQSLERLLENSETKLEIKEKLSSVCGKGKGRGINNAYYLIDAMFSRHFLSTCSWAGGSKTTEAKICFKSFTQVLKLFFELVHESDHCFTVNECHNFFKNVLKNSRQRIMSKQLRTSATKNRPKKNLNTNNTTLASVEVSKPGPSGSQSNNNDNSSLKVDVDEIFV